MWWFQGCGRSWYPARVPFTGPMCYLLPTVVLAAKSSLCTRLRLVPTLCLAMRSRPLPGMPGRLHSHWRSVTNWWGCVTAQPFCFWVDNPLQYKSFSKSPHGIRQRPTLSWATYLQTCSLRQISSPHLPSRILPEQAVKDTLAQESPLWLCYQGTAALSQFLATILVIWVDPDTFCKILRERSSQKGSLMKFIVHSVTWHK